MKILLPVDGSHDTERLLAFSVRAHCKVPVLLIH